MIDAAVDTVRLAILAVLISLSTTNRSAGDNHVAVDFNRDIRPIMSDKCFFCHGPDPEHREVELRLDVEAEAKDFAIVEGKPDESAFFLRITSGDPEERMPPAKSGKKLTKKEIDLLQRWIDQGAPYEPYWAYQPPRRHEPPEVKNGSWSRQWIDRFIVARLEAEGLQPARDADRVTLLRRLSFDLNGLPPTPEEVALFVKHTEPNAYEKVVDRLLASERFGERMAMYWLDLVRYADTVGYHGDQDHNISPYRDYVVDAFNDNMPFDQFTREQLAGDLLDAPTIDQQIATGYNRLLQTSHEGGVQPKEYLAIYAADRVRNVSNVWMGATMGCCQCHDHKYDPYTMKDFYSMVAFFADIDEAKHFKKGTNSLPTARPPEIKVHTKREREQLARWRAELATSEPGSNESKSLKQQIDHLSSNARMTMITVATQPRTTRVLPRGNWLDDSGPVVEPAIPEFLGELKKSGRRATRMDLATWLTDAEHGVGGLTARVFANRFWYLLLGVGISDTLDDFGGQGQPPEHPELLDNLAMEFVESGWDVKHMMKLIVMSRAYRQASMESTALRERDPYNRLYARQSRYRLPAEMVRDTALAVSGLLVERVGGASVKPYQPTGYYRHLNFPTRRYEAHTDARQWRRGLYVHWQRQFLHPMLKALDAPSREECTAQRARSNTPLAALTLLNDPTFVEAACALARRTLRAGGETDAQRVAFAFLQAISRSPDEVERDIVMQLLDGNRKYYVDQPEKARHLVSTGLTPVPEGIDTAELAAWTATARAILNMNETISRN